METRTNLNITSNKQFPPLQQPVTNDIYNNMLDDESGDDESLLDLAHKNRLDYDSEDEDTLEDITTILRS